MRSKGYIWGKNTAKSSVLAVFLQQNFLLRKKLTVNELLEADAFLRSRYGKKPHVLSNTLRRYQEQGLLRREEIHCRGHPFRYWMTDKGFDRLAWMLLPENREQYFPQGKWFIDLLLKLIVEELENRMKRNGTK